MTNPVANFQWLLWAQQEQNRSSQNTNRTALSSPTFDHVASTPVSSHMSMARLLSSIKESDAGNEQKEPGYAQKGGSSYAGSETQARLKARSLSQTSDSVGNHSVGSNRINNTASNVLFQPVSHLKYNCPVSSTLRFIEKCLTMSSSTTCLSHHLG